MGAMNNTVITLISIFFFFAFISQCYSECQLSGLKLEQESEGKINGTEEFRVWLTTECPCKFGNVMLNCAGFKSKESINPAILKIQGNTCLINDGYPVTMYHPVTFTYSWADTPYPFHVVTAKVIC
ncbi:hypothetical protein HN51_008981 [Arachis hypogaea]|uniref:Uncharacterized protein n=2 Tax=Arachis TaxID=3817 RepID=A0A445D1A2_ARAHY|nr:uncharacterized protein At1g05835 [Arachis duranensis]XP_025697617.1 uncharacterized protein At1g05835 [Arachis hypogaea]QHO43375.1 Protein TAPETUM DETERMINANT [Arachis hypogaea]RYR56942.1 hypothetical protein Ahy_A05g022679 [Arachis hypogaea]